MDSSGPEDSVQTVVIRGHGPGARADRPARRARRGTLLEPGAEVGGRYRIERLLGAGGMARVWLAEDLERKIHVAFKEMNVPAVGTPAEIEESSLLFRREYFAMKKLQHPGTVKVYDCGLMETGHRYITMEVVDGKDLHEIAKQTRFTSDGVRRMLSRLAQILGFVHSRLFVHCDIKAENIRITETGEVKLMDFGIMHPMGARASHRVWGTPMYMAPEWRDRGVVDARSDLYSLGCLLFELLTGKPPFTGPAMEVLLAHASKPAPAAGVSDRIDAFVARLLAKRPEDRPQSAGDVVVAIDGLKRSARSTVSLRRAREPSWRIGAVIAVLAVAAVSYAGVTLARAPDGVEDEPADEPTAPVDPHGNARRQVLDDDGELTFRALLPEPIHAHESVGFHLELWNKLGQPIDAPELVVTVEDPHGTAAGLSAKGHGAKEKRHFGFHYRFPSDGHYAVRVFPPGSSSTFQLDVTVEP